MVGEFGDDRFGKRSYEVRFSPLFDDQGRHIGASSTSYDVTDRVLADEDPDLPVLIISGYADTEGIAPEFTRLIKPFRLDELGERLASLRQFA